MLGAVTASLLPEKPKRQHLEEDFQRQVVQFLRWALPADAVFFHIPNGMQRHKRAAARLVGLGVRAGIADLCLIWRGRPIFLELKTPRGALSAVQRQMHEKLSAAGADVMTCRTLACVEHSLREHGVPLRGSVAA